MTSFTFAHSLHTFFKQAQEENGIDKMALFYALHPELKKRSIIILAEMLLRQILTDFQKYFKKDSVISTNHTIKALLHYLVKCHCSKDRRAQELNEASCHEYRPNG